MSTPARLASITLHPFERVNGTSFTCTRAELLAARGAPWHSGRNEVGLNELDYGDVVYRFEDCGRLEEITQQAQVVRIGNVALRFDALAAFVREQDPGLFERAGFLVSPRLGIAFDPSQPYWVTALARHCLPAWEALRVSAP